MRKTLIVLMFVFVAIPATGRRPVLGQDWQRDRYDRDLPEKEETHQTYELAPGANIEVTDISGPVEIETTNSNIAEVHIVRSARNRADLDDRKIVVEHSANRLAVRTQKGSSRRREAEVRQRVMLRVPRNVSLTTTDISGRVRVGEIDGPVKIHDISGKVEVGRAGGYSEISDISGSVTVTIARLGERGIHVNDISGTVELRLAGEVNADLSVQDISGHVSVEVPNVTVSGKLDSSNFKARIGSGGAPISISDISGSVTIRRADIKEG